MPFQVVGIGEVLWDLLPSGPQLGGAPANFVYHAGALGARASLVTRVGSDDLGQAIRQRFAQAGVDLNTMQGDDEAPTGTVTVALSGEGIPEYVIREDVAWDRLAVTPASLDAVRRADAVCFGSLAQRGQVSRSSIQTLVAAAPPAALRLFDVNLRQAYFSRQVLEQSLRLANVLKLNDDELPVLAQLFGLTGSTRHQIEALAGTFELGLVALTRGSAGSLLFQAGAWSDRAAAPGTVVDTIGAGDAFSAALVLGMLSKMPLASINAVADEVARHVCSCAGATPQLPRRLVERFAGRSVAT
jgi:fructokinase